MSSGEGLRIDVKFEHDNDNPEIKDQAKRETFQERGDKVNESKMETDRNLENQDLANLTVEEIRAKYSQEEILALKAKLEREYRERFGVEYTGKVSATTSETETSETEIPVKDTSGIDVMAGPATDETPEETPDEEPEPVSSTAPTEPLVPPISPESTPGVKSITSEQIAQNKKETNQNSKGQSFFSSTAKKAIGIALAAVLAVGGIAAAVGAFSHNGAANAGESADPGSAGTETPKTEQVQAAGEQHEQHGIQDGYNKKGMWESKAKSGLYDFAAASEVREVVGDNPAEMIIYTAENQSESMASYYAHVPDQLRPNFLKGINTIAGMEERLENATDDEYDIAKMQFEEVFRSNATYEEVTIDGDFHNVYMNKKDANGAVNHQNMQAVDCVTHESGTKVIKVNIYVDGKVVGSFYIKDKTCIQPLDQVGGENEGLYSGMNTVPDNPSNPDNPNPPTPPEPTPPGPDTPEWGKSGDPHSGENRLPSDLVDPDSEISQAENDAANAGNQGYVDDNQAAPGSASENNGTDADGFSQIITGGADTDGGRMSGNDQQGSGELNGNNDNAPTQEQLARDEAGNTAQDNGNTAGGNNNSNAQEQARVAGGQF